MQPARNPLADLRRCDAGHARADLLLRTGATRTTREVGRDSRVHRTAGRFSSPTVLTAALFVTLWNFNPFNTTVLYLYATEEIGLSETYYGTTVSLVSVGSLVASLATAPTAVASRSEC